MPAQSDRIAGGLWGLLIGDALGVPYEFNPPEDLPPLEQIDFIPPPDFERSHDGIPPGTWSDDGAQALCLLDSLLECGTLDVEDFGSRLVRWYDRGYLAVDNLVFDVGVTTAAAINALRFGVAAQDAGPSGTYDNGNGSLMRVLPLVLWHRGSDESLVQDAHLQSRVTHGHPRSQVCCALYCLWARYTLHEAPDAWQEAVHVLRTLYANQPKMIVELEWSFRPDEEPQGSGSGYVVDSLRSARWATQQGNYEQTVKAAIALGHDTDTTACIAGGIAGLREGIGAIPAAWRTALRGQELVEPLLKRLLALT